MTTTLPTTTVAAEGALSDKILQAARAIVERDMANPGRYSCSPYAYGCNPWKDCGIKNPPLLTLLDMLLGAVEPVANAIADNAWDEKRPVSSAAAKDLAEHLHRIADTLTAAASAPDSTGWSLPSCSGKELV